MRLTEAQRDFLRCLAPAHRPVTRAELSKTATREQDKIRQSCRRAGWVEFVGGKLEDGVRYRMGWRITEAGRRALSQAEGGAK